MKLSSRTEWIVVGVLIVYIAFVQPIPMLRDALATSVGKAVGLAAIVYVWKYVSAVVAILLAIAFVRCAKTPVWEMFSGAETSCECEMPEEYMWDVAIKKCRNKDGKEGAVKSCVCAAGYAWDGGAKGKKECIPVTTTQPPVPATNPVADNLAEQAKKDAEMVQAMDAAPATAAPAAPAATGPAGTTPATTPGAAAEKFANPVPMPGYSGGVVPSGVSSSMPAMV
jgi:hypothetical protein